MKDKSLGKKILYVFIAIVFAAICFGAGFLTRMFTQSSAVSSYSWALDTIRQYYYQDIPEGDITNLTLKQLAYYYLDKYSAYYTAEEFASVTASNAGSKSGIGIRSDYVNASVGKGIYINSVVFNSPAYYAGLSAGTIITNVKYTNSDGSESSVEINSYSDFTSCLNNRSTNEDFTLITSQGDYTISKQNYTAGYCLMSTNGY
jgi:C-terminal processing protease CtpA/Prc